MPYVKRISIKTGLVNSLNYVADHKRKTESYINNALNYISQKNKVFNVYSFNCASNPRLALQEMNYTKRAFAKSDKVQGYHYIQSFKPGEATPEVAHLVGKEFAERVFPGHQVLIATHIDRGHIHNHFVLNSVNLVTGKKFISSNKTLYKARDVSDEISLKYNLSIIEKTSSKEFVTDGRPVKPKVKYDLARKDIDKAINNSNSYLEFKVILVKEGYRVKENKYLTVTPPGYEKAIRTNSLGQMYARDFIIKRIENKSIDFKKFFKEEELNSLRRLSRAEKNEKLAEAITQINFLKRYDISFVGDIPEVEKKILNEIRTVNKTYTQISKQEALCVGLINDIKYLLANTGKTSSTIDSRISETTDKLKNNGVPMNRLSEVVEELEISREELNIRINELKSENFNLKSDLEILKRLERENSPEKDIGKEYKPHEQPER